MSSYPSISPSLKYDSLGALYQIHGKQHTIHGYSRAFHGKSITII
ncbi:hypothetical protein HMPREF9080_01258 [Cardiobacterium valvarum F0432]|uniref:Uncharacterized protein n=1 Tax=Cardiobacterium valvarum F0432 TaxID=797473 RepID=G9ZEK3_9GAMM|nr:hypothetical protein HMPREF9080_01258 [Cardiobacterium valvarum F0432]